MQDKKTYRKLLRKMYTIELLGDLLYAHLALKEKDIPLKEIYLKLADNERQTAESLCSELKKYNIDPTQLQSRPVIHFLHLIIKITPRSTSCRILRNILMKRMYSRWYELYNNANPDLWAALKAHEALQHKLLFGDKNCLQVQKAFRR